MGHKLNCLVNLYFLCLVKTCEGHPLKKIDIEKKMLLVLPEKTPRKIVDIN